MNAAVSPCTVLITGATGAIGAALARLYAAPGRVLVLHGRDVPRLEAVARDCTARGAEVETRALDLRDAAGWSAWLQDVASRRPVDLAIVNAGVISTTHAGAETESAAAEVFEVNVRAALATVYAVVPSMRRRRSGQIALVSSLLAWFGLPLAPAYSASKAALKTYGEAMRPVLAADGIRLSVVLPGFVKSAMSDELHVPKPFMVTPDAAALRICRGLARNQARISFPLPLSLGCRLLALLPTSFTARMLALSGYRA